MPGAALSTCVTAGTNHIPVTMETMSKKRENFRKQRNTLQIVRWCKLERKVISSKHWLWR